jgi:hypothetical protein
MPTQKHAVADGAHGVLSEGAGEGDDGPSKQDGSGGDGKNTSGRAKRSPNISDVERSTFLDLMEMVLPTRSVARDSPPLLILAQPAPMTGGP